MKIDIEYIKKILDVALEHTQPDFDIKHQDIKPLWETDELLSKLVFHMKILEDQSLIESALNSGGGLGFRRKADGRYSVAVTPLRLTATGHQFAADLKKSGVVEQLTTSFKDAGPKEMVNIVIGLGKKIVDKKMEDLFSD